MSHKIVIDPGHGGYDPGAQGSGLQEKAINLEISLNIRDMLANFADVSMTRESDVFVSLSERAAFANRVGADYFISVHVNAGGGTGFESYLHINAGQDDNRFGQAIHTEVAAFFKAKGFPDRGLKRANFAVLRETVMPAVLFENLFIDSSKDAAQLKDPVFRRELAKAIANGVIKVLNLQEPAKETPTQPSHWASNDFQRLVDTGLVFGDHNLDSAVTWGQMSAVLARLLDKINL